jgi:ABC-type multidrug transport system fused ATPase/permease subunit
MNWKKRLNNFGLSNGVIVLLIMLAFVSSITELASIGMFLPVFQLASQSGDLSSFSESDNSIVNSILQFFDYSFGLSELLLAIFLLFLISKITKFFIDKINAYYMGIMLKDMRIKLLDSYLKADASLYDQISISDFTNSSTVELKSAVNGIMIPIKFIITIISSLMTILFLFLLSYELTIVSISILIIVTLPILRWVKATTQAGKKNSSYNKIITTFLIRRLRSPRLVRLSGTGDAEIKQYKRITEKQRVLTLAIHVLKARISLTIEPLIIGISLLIMYYSLVFLGLGIETIILYLIIMVRMIPVVTTLLTQKQSINRAIGPIQAIENLVSLLKKHTLDQLLHQNKNSDQLVGSIKEIQLQDVLYSYNNSNSTVLNDVNISFISSSLSAIVGPSGSGKSTLVDIISCYRQPVSGSIYVNGSKLNETMSKQMIKLVSYVPQDPQLFEGTIHSHIAYGNPGATNESIYLAAKLSGAIEFINKLEHGFDTQILQDASNLSRGQKQRLDLSRAILTNSPVIILDEPTGNLDSIAEKKFIQTLHDIKKQTNKIVIMIAHRLNTVVDADQIIVLQDGVITGCGKHNELVSDNQWYAEAVNEYI